MISWFAEYSVTLFVLSENSFMIYLDGERWESREDDWNILKISIFHELSPLLFSPFTFISLVPNIPLIPNVNNASFVWHFWYSYGAACHLIKVECHLESKYCNCPLNLWELTTLSEQLGNDWMEVNGSRQKNFNLLLSKSCLQCRTINEPNCGE